MSSSSVPDGSDFYDYSTKSVSSLYDEEGASSYYLTVEAAAIRLTLGLPAAYSSNNPVDESLAGSSMGEYSDVVESSSSEETEESSSATEKIKQTNPTESSSSSSQIEILSNVPSSIRDLKRSTASSSSGAKVGYDDIYSGGSPENKKINSTGKIDASFLPLPRNQLKSMDLRLIDPFDKFFWSEQFFKIHESYLQKLNSSASSSEDPELLDIYFRLSAHAQDFVSTAEKYAKIVISEKNLPYEKKTVKPAREIGGIAGGEKYVCQGIMLKFALDNRGIYGSDDSAIKSAGHDLNGLTLYYQCNIQGLYVPLMCAIDYKGYRVLCLSVLNINSETLCYGSSDGGRTIHADDPALNQKMKLAASILHLAEHSVGSESSSRSLHSACDLEGHVIEGGKRSVLLDFARAMPPEPPTKRNRSCIFYRMLRPELVRRSPVPLSADSYSKFQSRDPNRHQLNQNTTAAWRNLTEVILPELASDLAKREKDDANASSLLTDESTELVTEMHNRGCNIRYLGFLRRLLVSNESKKWQSVASVEMVARVVKRGLHQILRKAMGDFMMPSEELYRRVAVEYLNLILGNGPASEAYWNSQILQAVHLTFCYLLYESCEDDQEHEELKLFVNCPLCSEINFWTEIDRSSLFMRLSKLLPLDFSPSCLRELSSPVAFQEATPLEDTDVVALTARIKNMPIIDKGKAFMFYRQAKQSARPDVAKTLLEAAIEKFKVALKRLPDNLTFHCAANSYYLLAKLQADHNVAVSLLRRAFASYRQVSAGFRDNTSCWFEAIGELENRLLKVPSIAHQELYINELNTYLTLGKYVDPSDPHSWVEEADLLAASSEKLAGVLSSKDVGFDDILRRAVQLYSAAARKRTTTAAALGRLASLFMRRATFFRDLDLLTTEEKQRNGEHLACAEARYQIFLRRCFAAVRKCIALKDDQSPDLIHTLRSALVSDTTNLFFKYVAQQPSLQQQQQNHQRLATGVPAFAKAVAQPLLWQNLLISQHQDGKDIEIWDIQQIISRPKQVPDPSHLLRVSLRGASSTTIRAISVEFDYLFVSDDSNSVRVWSLRSIRQFMKTLSERSEAKRAGLTSSSSKDVSQVAPDKVEIEYASNRFHGPLSELTLCTLCRAVPNDSIYRTIFGSDKQIIAMALDSQTGFFYTASKGGTLRAWPLFGLSSEKQSTSKSAMKIKVVDLGVPADAEVKCLAALQGQLYVCFANKLYVVDVSNHTHTRVLRQLDSVSKRPHSAVVQISVVPKSNVIILMTTGTKIKIYGLDDLQKRVSIRLEDSFNRQLAVLGDVFACIVRRGFRLYDCANGQLVSSFDDAHKDDVTALCWDPTNRVILTRSSDKSAFFWRLDLVEWRKLSAPHNELESEPEIWDPRTLKSLGTGPLFPRALGDMLAFRGKLAIAIESSVALVDASTLRMIRPEVQQHTDHISGMFALADDEHFLTSAWDGSIRLWKEGEDGNLSCVGFATAHQQKIRRMIIWGRNRFITGSKDRTVKIWEVEEVKPFKLKCLSTLKGFGGSVLSLTVVEDDPCPALACSWLFAGDATGQAKLFDLKTFKCLQTFPAANGKRVLAMAHRFDLRRKILIAGASTKYDNLRDFQQRGDAPHECVVWDISNLPQISQIGQFCGHTGGVSDLICLGDYILSLGLDNRTVVNDAASFEQIHVFTHHAPPACFLHSFGRTYLGGYNSIVSYLDPTTQSLDSSLAFRIKKQSPTAPTLASKSQSRQRKGKGKQRQK